MIDYTFLFIGLIYATILPGLVVTELILPKLAFWKKLPLYLLLSVIISCYFTYFSALALGLNRLTISGCFLFFLISLLYILFKRKTNITAGFRKNWKIVLIGVLIYVAYFTALYPAIFKFYSGYFVMGGPNWQDTAMHLSIIESFAQGNFPPQAPYFSGAPLSYYYFADFHAGIVNTMFGQFFPGILVLLNPMLAMTFFFSVFALSYQITKKRVISAVAGIMAVFYGSFGFINMLYKLATNDTGYISLITSDPFNFDKKYIQMAPMADYFLQNRPMMIGLPVFVTVIMLLTLNYKSDRKSIIKVFVAGLLTGAMVKFQLFAFINAWMFFGIYIGANLLFKKIKFRTALKYAGIFSPPSLILMLIFITTKVESRSFVQIFIESFRWGPWQQHDPFWFVCFLAVNMGLGFLIFILGVFSKSMWKKTEILAIYLLALFNTAIPLAMTFTLYEFDMLKFFYYLAPLICVFLAFIFANSNHKRISTFVFVLIMLVSSLTSLNMLIHSYLNKTEGYSLPDYESGIWIRGNTSQKSVFVTMPTVHSAPSDIGGRLRVISYINWPYSHGFNTGKDNVFSRVEDVTNVYKTGSVSVVASKYGANYVFYGREEAGEFPEAGNIFDLNKSLKLIYNHDNIKIYKII